MLAPQRRAGCQLHAWQLPAAPLRLRAVRSPAVSATRRTVSEAQGRSKGKTEAQRLSKVWGLLTHGVLAQQLRATRLSICSAWVL